jgi:hypothetical protein
MEQNNKMKRNKNTFELIFVSLIFLFAFSVNLFAQNKPYSTIKSGKTIIKGTLQPKTKNDSQSNYINAKKGQTLSVEVNSKSIMLSETNECGIYFMIYDAKGKALTEGDYFIGGADSWKGKITKTGRYRIKVFMDCIEITQDDDLQKYKPKFRYSLEILLK